MSNIAFSPRRSISAGLIAFCAIGIFVVVLLSGCGAGSSTTGTNAASANAASANATGSNAAGTKATTIRLQNIAIHPLKITIQRGSTVTWQWLDGHIDTAHNVTSLPGGSQFKASGTRQTGSYTVRFNTPGKYFYECTIHPASMQGEIVVQ
jgi:plastocyanin